MTPDEFEFWQKAYLAALTGWTPAISRDWVAPKAINAEAIESANLAVESYRTSKATVVNKVYAVEND